MASLDQTVRAVCSGCNHGWMAELERRAQPVLGQLIASPARRWIPRGHLDLVATWCTKTALVASLLTHGEGRTIPIAHFHWFFERRHRFPGSKAWVGAYRVTSHSLFSSSTVSFFRPRSGAYRTTINVGALVFQLIVIPGFGDLLTDVEPPGDIARSLKPLYPRRTGMLWPPRNVMSEHDLHVVSAIDHDAWTDRSRDDGR